MLNKIKNVYVSLNDGYKKEYCKRLRKKIKFTETYEAEYAIENIDRVTTYGNHADYLVKFKDAEKTEKFSEYDLRIKLEGVKAAILRVIKESYLKKKDLVESYRYEIVLPITDNTSKYEDLRKYVNLRCAYIPGDIEV